MRYTFSVEVDRKKGVCDFIVTWTELSMSTTISIPIPFLKESFKHSLPQPLMIMVNPSHCTTSELQPLHRSWSQFDRKEDFIRFICALCKSPEKLEKVRKIHMDNEECSDESDSD